MLWTVCFFAGANLALAQTSTVTGVVTSSEGGEPVVGASVLIVGTQKGITTDVDGKFTITNVPANAKTLRVSFMGMQPKDVAITPGKTIKVMLQADPKLGTVV